MSNREFGKRFSANDGKGHGDQWVSNLLKDPSKKAGAFALSLDELDEAARAVKSTAAQLVRHPDDEAEYLRPTEKRALQALRSLPPVIRDHLVTLLEYLIGVAPEEVAHVQEFRRLTQDEQAKVEHWTHALLLSREPLPGPRVPDDPPETGGTPAVKVLHSHRKPPK